MTFMSFLIGFLYVVEVVVCLLLALVVMLQRPKEGGLGGAIGGGMGEAVFGADASNVLVKATTVLGVIFLLNTLVLARLTSTIHSKSVLANEAPAPIQQQRAEAASVAAPAPAPAAKPASAPASAVKPVPAPAPAAKPVPVKKPVAPAKGK